MHLDASNNFSEYRQLYWNDDWPIAKEASRDAGYRDFLVADYYPFAELFNNALEYSIDYRWSSVVTRHYIHTVWIVIGLYLISVFGGKRLMRDRKAFDLKFSLAAWNLLLALFSLLGALRLLPHLLYVTAANGPVYFLCRAVARAYSDAPVYFWVVLFIYSKYAELLDTAFLVLRKRPISFLHWFHHATVTIYCWYSFGNQVSTGIWFAGMNYLVHAIMYFYYFLAAVGEPPNWGFAVTTLQLAQMFVGMVVNVAHYYYAAHIQHCDISYAMVYAAFFMYACYAALFAHFFIERYLRKKRQRSAKATPVASDAAHRNGNGHAHVQCVSKENGGEGARNGRTKTNGLHDKRD